MDFMHILGQKEAIWSTTFSIFERRRGPPNVAGPGKLSFLPPSRRACLYLSQQPLPRRDGRLRIRQWSEYLLLALFTQLDRDQQRFTVSEVIGPTANRQPSIARADNNLGGTDV